MIANLDSICEGILMLEDVKGIQEDIFKMELELFQLKNILFIYNVISQSIHIQNNLNISSFAVTKQQTNKNSENGSKMPKINNNFKIKMSQNRKIKTKKRQKLLRVKLLSDLNDKITINSYKINNIFFIKMDIQFQRLGDSTTAIVYQSNKQMKLDNYTVCKDVILGKGSFSLVYLCRSNQNKKAAVKVLNKNSKKSEHIIKVAKAQVKIIRKIKHPNIVRYIGSYQSQNNYYILFQYCQGKTLRQILNQYKKLQRSDISKIVSGLINALCYLFQKKVMHRDIKPDNIKYFKEKATLIDFGFACELKNGQKTMISQSVGTPSYMSPQMLKRQKYNYKSDIWSLGVVIYEIIYGRLPWNGRTESQLYSNIQSQPLKFPSSVQISPFLRKLLEDCLQKKSSNRMNMNTLSQYKNVEFNQQRLQKKSQFCDFLCWFN